MLPYIYAFRCPFFSRLFSRTKKKAQPSVSIMADTEENFEHHLSTRRYLPDPFAAVFAGFSPTDQRLFRGWMKAYGLLPVDDALWNHFHRGPLYRAHREKYLFDFRNWQNGRTTDISYNRRALIFGPPGIDWFGVNE